MKRNIVIIGTVTLTLLIGLVLTLRNGMWGVYIDKSAYESSKATTMQVPANCVENNDAEDVPSYPDTEASVKVIASKSHPLIQTFTMTTSDTVEKVLAYYDDALLKRCWIQSVTGRYPVYEWIDKSGRSYWGLHLELRAIELESGGSLIYIELLRWPELHNVPIFPGAHNIEILPPEQQNSAETIDIDKVTSAIPKDIVCKE